MQIDVQKSIKENYMLHQNPNTQLFEKKTILSI